MITIWLLISTLCCSTLCAQNDEVAFLENTLSLNSEPDLIGDLIYVPFEWQDGKILVSASIEGVRRTFMLDTGAPSLVLNEQIEEKTKSSARGISGEVQITQKTVQSFEWAGIQTKKLEALVLNMEHLEIAAKTKLAGLIGYDVLKNAEVLFDYERRLILLSKTHKSSWHKGHKPRATIDFIMEDHLPVLKVKIDKKTLYLGLDSGAECNILDEKVFNKIPKSLISKNKQEKLIGLDRKEKSVNVAWISDTQIKKETFSDMKYLFTDLSALQNEGEIQLDGLLGAPFFQSATFSINYRKQKLYIW